MGEAVREPEFLFPKEKKMGYCPKADKIPSSSLGLVADYQRLYHK